MGNIGNSSGSMDALLPTTAPSPTHTNDSLSVLNLNGSSHSQDTSNVNNTNTRRHSRLHSRNLCIFFPRPGSVSEASIAEDGAQEIQVDYTSSVAASNIPEPTPDHQEILKGFTFGGRPGSGKTTTTSSSGLTPDSAGLAPGSGSGMGSTSRRGHHKHSLSHQFFFFLEPGTSGEQLHTQPTPIPVSPWNPISPFPDSAGKGKKGITPGNGIVVTMELHVRQDLADDDVLELTKWAWERCVNALHFGTGGGGVLEMDGLRLRLPSVLSEVRLGSRVIGWLVGRWKKLCGYGMDGYMFC